MDVRKKLHRKFRLHRRIEDNLPWCPLRKYTRKTLAEFFGEIGFNVGAEIGVRRGAYSKVLCDSNPKLKLFCIDPWNKYHPAYTEDRQGRIYNAAIKTLSPYNTEIIRKNSMDALSDIEDEFLDFVFIDGNHTFDYVMCDIIFWNKKVKPGGIIACHDYYSFKWAGVRFAVDAYTGAHHIDPWYVTKELEPTAFWIKPENMYGAM